MSLLPFHRVLIASAIVFCAGFSLWELMRYSSGGGTTELVTGLVFAVLAGALIVYFWHMRRILGLPRRPPRPPR